MVTRTESNNHFMNYEHQKQKAKLNCVNLSKLKFSQIFIDVIIYNVEITSAIPSMYNNLS